MSKFNTKSEPSVNLAGGKAVRIEDPTMELFNLSLTTFLKNSFYEKGEDRIGRIRQCVAQILEEGTGGVEWLCQLAILLREQFHMRSVVHVILGELALQHKGNTPHAFTARTIAQTAKRPDDLSEILAYMKKRGAKSIPKQVKRGIRRGLLKFDRYQLAKYQMKGHDYSLVDLFNISHPNPEFVDSKTEAAWKELMEGKLKCEDTWESALSNAKDDAARRLALCDLIAENKLGYMALIRNLNNLMKYKVPPRIMSMALEKLTDPEEIANSRMMPFRYWNAYKNVKGDPKVTNAISEAMDEACGNSDGMYGNTLIAIDSSGSMHNKGDEHDTTPFEKACVLAAIILKNSPSGIHKVILYSDRVSIPVVSTNIPVANMVSQLEGAKIDGGTDTSLVFQHMRENNPGLYKNVIILSDNESWGGDVMEAYKKLKADAKIDPKVYAIDIQGYGTLDITGENVVNISGWSDRIIDLMRAEGSAGDYVNMIENVYIGQFNTREREDE